MYVSKPLHQNCTVKNEVCLKNILIGINETARNRACTSRITLDLCNLRTKEATSVK